MVDFNNFDWGHVSENVKQELINDVEKRLYELNIG